MNNVEIKNKTSMLYWYPKVKDLPIPQPKTEIVLTKDFHDWWHLLDGEPLSSDDIKILEDAGDNIGYPLFLRTDLCSGKHDYMSTCYVAKKEDLGRHIFNMVDDNCCKDLTFTSMVFREFIKLDWKFHAFNCLPIAPERRYFIEDGEAVCHHPYWPEDAIQRPDNDDWRRLLEKMNTESYEIRLLTKYSNMVGDVLGGDWSIDFALSGTGTWYLIDMATAIQSWHPTHEGTDCDITRT